MLLHHLITVEKHKTSSHKLLLLSLSLSLQASQYLLSPHASLLHGNVVNYSQELIRTSPHQFPHISFSLCSHKRTTQRGLLLPHISLSQISLLIVAIRVSEELLIPRAYSNAHKHKFTQVHKHTHHPNINTSCTCTLLTRNDLH